ncbi:MAG: nucleotidyltransferase domain-containing protein [Elusimicrobia bacterium]|nr:nucleotidyltransferase domain-containing protein [Elusimicrobiota bacterium]
MEKSQYDLCVKVLKRLEKVGILKNLVLIGSWCIPFYKEYFGNIKYSTAIKTRDIDFLVPYPSKTKQGINIPELLKDLGFIIGFKGDKGYIQLEHPELIIEFLAPEKGRGLDKPYQLPQFNLNAQALRFLDLIIQNTIKVKIENIEVSLPHPVHFALHKLIVSQRRAKEEKAKKDRNAAIEILRALISKGDTPIIRQGFKSMLLPWQKKILKVLENAKELEILNELK